LTADDVRFVADAVRNKVRLGQFHATKISWSVFSYATTFRKNCVELPVIQAAAPVMQELHVKVTKMSNTDESFYEALSQIVMRAKRLRKLRVEYKMDGYMRDETSCLSFSSALMRSKSLNVVEVPKALDLLAVVMLQACLRSKTILYARHHLKADEVDEEDTEALLELLQNNYHFETFDPPIGGARFSELLERNKKYGGFIAFATAEKGPWGNFLMKDGDHFIAKRVADFLF